MQQSNDTEKQLAELQTRQAAWKQLVGSQGWRDLCAIVEGAITSRRQNAFGKLASVQGLEDCFMLANIGSEVSGMQFVIALPHVLLKDVEQDIKRAIIAERENENGTD